MPAFEAAALFAGAVALLRAAVAGLEPAEFFRAAVDVLAAIGRVLLDAEARVRVWLFRVAGPDLDPEAAFFFEAAARAPVALTDLPFMGLPEALRAEAVPVLLDVRAAGLKGLREAADALFLVVVLELPGDRVVFREEGVVRLPVVAFAGIGLGRLLDVDVGVFESALSRRAALLAAVTGTAPLVVAYGFLENPATILVILEHVERCARRGEDDHTTPPGEPVRFFHRVSEVFGNR